MSEQQPTPRKRRYFAGTTVEQALVLAARYHQLDPTQIAYRKIEKRHGFIKVPRRVVLEVDPESPRRSQTAVVEVQPPAAPKPAAPAPAAPPPRPRPVSEPPRRALEPMPVPPPAAPLPVEAEGDVLAAARRAVRMILEFARLDLAAEVRLEAGELLVELTGRDRPLLLEDEAELLMAIEHLIPRCLGPDHRDRIGCRVDSEGFRSGRETELKSLAAQAAETVRSDGGVVRLDPLSPSERRVIHMALAGDPEVVTESEGDGFFKRVTIRKA